MPIQLVNDIIEITYDSEIDSKGGSWDNPWRATDIVSAIINVTQQGNQIYIPYRTDAMGIGCYLLIEDKQIKFSGSVVDFYANLCNFRAFNTSFVGNNNYFTTDGYQQIISNCSFSGFSPLALSGKEDDKLLFQHNFISGMRMWIRNSYIDLIENLFVNNSYIQLYDGTEMKGNVLYNLQIRNAIWIQPSDNVDFNIDNFSLSDVIYSAIMAEIRANVNVNIRNCKITTNQVSSDILGTGTHIYKYQKNLKGTIQNASKKTLKIYDKNDNLVSEEILSSNEIPERWINYAMWKGVSDGDTIEVTEEIYEPFKFKVEKTGYQTLEIPNIYCTIDGIGTLSPTVVEGKMVLVEVTGENLQHFITEDVLEHVITEDKLTHEITD